MSKHMTRLKLRVGQYVLFWPSDGGGLSQEGLVMHISADRIVRVLEKNGIHHEITFEQIKGIIP